METQESQSRLQELAELRDRVARLERELEPPPEDWQANRYYAAYYATTGFMLGIFGALTSLMFNVVGALLVQKHPFHLIQVYLTFPLRERALELDDGLSLAIGCCLYLGTGMLLGVPCQLVLGWLTPRSGLPARLAVATVLGLLIWVINFYGILAWLQPALFGGSWIVDEIPAWVAALTHLVFAWTMAIVYPLGAYVPYRRQTETL